MRSGPPAPWPGASGGRRHEYPPCQCRSGGVVRAALGPLAWRGNRRPAMASAARAAPAQKSAVRCIIYPHNAARAGLWSAGGPRSRARNCAARRMALAGYSRRAAARARCCCPAAGRMERSTRGAFDAVVPSSDGALAASGGDERAVETLSPPPPVLERRAAVGRSLHGRVALSTAGRKCTPGPRPHYAQPRAQLNWSVEDKHGRRHR
jgi:hypothetical protein